jgi:hypothetical protein
LFFTLLIASSTSGRPVIITDETRRQISSSIDTTPQEQHTQPREHQTRIKHRSVKGQTYRLKLFNKNIIVPFDRLWLLTVFDRYKWISILWNLSPKIQRF